MNIKQIRDKTGLTQKELAEIIGVRRESVNLWENKKIIPQRSLKCLVRYLMILELINEIENNLKIITESKAMKNINPVNIPRFNGQKIILDKLKQIISIK